MVDSPCDVHTISDQVAALLSDGSTVTNSDFPDLKISESDGFFEMQKRLFEKGKIIVGGAAVCCICGEIIDQTITPIY